MTIWNNVDEVKETDCCWHKRLTKPNQFQSASHQVGCVIYNFERQVIEVRIRDVEPEGKSLQECHLIWSVI